jgi:hypothetical protein
MGISDRMGGGLLARPWAESADPGVVLTDRSDAQCNCAAMERADFV